MLRHVLLENVVLDRPLQLRDGNTLLFGGGNVKAEQHGRRAVNGHGGGDLVERDSVEQGLHVCQTRHCDAALADLALGTRMIRVIPHEGGKIEGHGKAGLAPLQPELVAGVGIFCGAEAGKLAHGPEPAAIHGRVNAASIREVARQSGCRDDVLGQIECGVHRFNASTRGGGRLRVRANRHTPSPGSPGSDLGPEALELDFLLGNPRDRFAATIFATCCHIFSPCFSSSSTSCASSYGLTCPRATSSNLSVISCSARVSCHTHFCVARSTTSRVRSISRRLRRLSSSPEATRYS